VLLIIDEGQNLSDQASKKSACSPICRVMTSRCCRSWWWASPSWSAGSSSLHAPVLAADRRHYHLTGLDRDETGKYITHRLRKAGARAELFTSAAVDLIYQLSGGIPAAINLVCQAALVYGFAEGANKNHPRHHPPDQQDKLCVGVEAVTHSLRSAPVFSPKPAAPSQRQRLRAASSACLESDIRDLKEFGFRPVAGYAKTLQKLRENQFRQLVQLLKQERQQKRNWCGSSRALKRKTNT